MASVKSAAALSSSPRALNSVARRISNDAVLPTLDMREVSASISCSGLSCARSGSRLSSASASNANSDHFALCLIVRARFILILYHQKRIQREVMAVNADIMPFDRQHVCSIFEVLLEVFQRIVGLPPGRIVALHL